jgi:hypothetical protein
LFILSRGPTFKGAYAMETSFLWKLWKLQSSLQDSNPMISDEGGLCFICYLSLSLYKEKTELFYQEKKHGRALREGGSTFLTGLSSSRGASLVRRSSFPPKDSALRRKGKEKSFKAPNQIKKSSKSSKIQHMIFPPHTLLCLSPLLRRT